MLDDDDAMFALDTAAAAVFWRTEERALRVLGVTAEVPEPTIARKAAVFGEGGGKATGPPTRGVRPVEGVRPVRNAPEASKLKERAGAGPFTGPAPVGCG